MALSLVKADEQAQQQAQDIMLAQQGCQQAFHRLYQATHRRIFALCLRMLGHVEQAEDCTQEVYIRAWRNLPQFKQQSLFITWLHSIACHSVVDYQRKHASWWQKVFSIEHTGYHEPSYQLPELSRLDQHILQLPEKMRHVFVLFALEGYRHEEIAQLLNMSHNTSKTHFFKAKQKLQEWLGDE